MRLPFENYIKTLLATRRSTDDVMVNIRDMRLKITEKAVLDLKEQMYLEQTDYFEDVREPVDIDWLEDHNIDKMFGYLFDQQIRRPIKGAEGALKLFDDAQMYRMITSMALANVPADEIELIIQSKIDINYDYDDIVEFLNYFFNIEGWSKKDKELHVSTITNTDLKRAYKDAIVGDKNKLFWKLKLTPSKDFDEMLREMSYDCFYKFKEHLNGDADTALKFATTADKLMNRLEKSQEAERATQEAHTGLMFLFDEKDRNEIKTFDELKEEEEAS